MKAKCCLQDLERQHQRQMKSISRAAEQAELFCRRQRHNILRKIEESSREHQRIQALTEERHKFLNDTYWLHHGIRVMPRYGSKHNSKQSRRFPERFIQIQSQPALPRLSNQRMLNRNSHSECQHLKDSNLRSLAGSGREWTLLIIFKGRCPLKLHNIGQYKLKLKRANLVFHRASARHNHPTKLQKLSWRSTGVTVYMTIAFLYHFRRHIDMEKHHVDLLEARCDLCNVRFIRIRWDLCATIRNLGHGWWNHLVFITYAYFAGPLIRIPILRSVGWFNMKMPSYRYRNFQCGGKTI